MERTGDGKRTDLASYDTRTCVVDRAVGPFMGRDSKLISLIGDLKFYFRHNIGSIA